ncbi:hypothetical protein [Nostoc sp.]|uniref:hypothetical protein n=1 Tax=Nostoc sp. TaxID=1180 RepID=UPI002FF7C8D4
MQLHPLNNIRRNRSSNSLQIWQQTKIPDNFCEVGDFVRSPAQKIQRVHNRVSGSLVTEDAVSQQKVLSRRNFTEENY